MYVFITQPLKGFVPELDIIGFIDNASENSLIYSKLYTHIRCFSLTYLKDISVNLDSIPLKLISAHTYNMEPHSKRLRIDLTPSEISQEIPQSLLPIACGPLSAKAYRDNHARPLVWLLFGGTGALGKQISRTAIARRDRVFIAALDEADTDCDFPLDKQGPILSNPEKIRLPSQANRKIRG